MRLAVVVMIIRNKKNLSLLLSLTISTLIYFLWVEYRPVKIIAVHQRNNYSDVLVENFPITDSGKIAWWMKNKSMLAEKYKIPKPASYGSFTIIFWDFGDGYQEEGKYDRLCFDDMKTTENCIDKNSFLTVRNTHDNRVFFIVDNGKYLLQESNKVIKVRE
ncbi:putative entero membrane protein [Yersinia wautersii]|uniref:Entero membrane protein n=2 Tax=Yersinia wautersii TaxID=1341643 RepID=A0ABM9TES2_9GAMM|nr:putative entero membrane protein [Yersinia wautersii]